MNRAASQELRASPERQLAEFVVGLRYDDLPPDVCQTSRNIVMAVCGTTIAGAVEDGCLELRDHLLAQGGAPDATILVHGGRLPAPRAALVNAVMARALDYCDAMPPGLHVGSSLVPAALAAIELRGGCDGREFITAIAAGTEVASRMNLTESMYDGFDPTGIAGVFGSTAVVCRLLGLPSHKTVHALALAFNRAAGSFQSNVDGSLAVRLIQGWVAESGVTCAQFADLGLTGPVNFIDGVYGYRHLHGRGRLETSCMTGDFGNTWRLRGTMFKKFASCGLTQGITELALRAIAERDFTAADVQSIDIRLPPYAHRLVGHEFELGTNPRVNAQFSARYCAANVIVRRGSALQHFMPEQVASPQIADLIRRIRVHADPALDARGHTVVDLQIDFRRGPRGAWSLDHPPGFPEAPLTQEEHVRRLEDCLAYASCIPEAGSARALVDAIAALDGADDVRHLIGLLHKQSTHTE